MDALGAIVTVKSMIDLTKQVYDVLQKARHALKERQQYLDEVLLVLQSLKFLQERLEDVRNGNPYSKGLLALVEPGRRFVPEKIYDQGGEGKSVQNSSTSKLPGGFTKMTLGAVTKSEPKGTYYYDADSYTEGGVLKRLRNLLEELTNDLPPRKGLKRVLVRVGWYWKESEVKEQVDNIVRLRGHIDSLLRQDQFDLSLANQVLGKDTNERVKEIQETQKHVEREKERQAIMTWLSPLEFYKRQATIHTDKYPTGQWLFDSPEFNAWVKGRSWALWLYGNPGAGKVSRINNLLSYFQQVDLIPKTVLCSNIIFHLEEANPTKRVIVLCLYLDYKEKESQTLENLIGSLVKQLIQYQQYGYRSKELKKMYQASRGEAKPKKDDMIRVLLEEFKAYSRVYLIVDGLNDASEAVRDELHALIFYDLKANNFSSLITSRYAEGESAAKTVECSVCHAPRLNIYWSCLLCDAYDLCDACKNDNHSCGIEGHELEERYDHVEVLVHATNDEIRDYVKWEMRRETKHENNRRRDKRIDGISLSSTSLARRLAAKPSLEEKIPDEIARKANGLYLLAHLYMDSLKNMLNVNEIETALLSLPDKLDAVYEEKMNRIINQTPRRNANWAKEILYWIIGTKRPLSLKELQHALAVKRGATKYDPDYETQEADIILCTAGLVTIDPETDTSNKRAVRMHVTFHVYLHKYREKWFPGTESNIAITLLTYLNFDELAQPCDADSGAPIESRLEKLPLLSYASQYWGDHIPNFCSEPQVRSIVLDFLSDVGKLASCIQAAYFVDEKLDNDLDVRKGLNGLHMSALYGLDPVVSDLVMTKGIPVDSIDPTYQQTALMYACRHGHLTTAKRLLELSASINVRSARERTPFFEAYLRNGEGQRQITILLLERADLRINEPSFAGENNRTALMMAVCFDDEEVLTRILNRHDINMNVRDSEGFTALSLAVLYQKTHFVTLLLSHPDTQLNLGNNVGSTPLAIAAQSGNTHIVELLLTKGADTSLKDDQSGGTALQRAVDQGQINIVQTFLRHHADLCTVDENGRGLLHSASINGHENIVRLLINAGLEKNATGSRGETPLHDACRQGYYEVARALLDEGADATIKDNSGRSPETVAWQNGHMKVLRLLKGNDNNANGTTEETIPDRKLLPTWSLAKIGLIEVIRQRILQLQKVAPEQSSPVTSSNLSDQDPDTENSALHFAVERKRYNILTLLLDAKLSPDCQNNIKRTPLHLAAFQNDLESTRSLLLHKPRQDLRDAWNMTALTIAQKHGSYVLAVSLIEAGAEVGEANRAYTQSTFFTAVKLRNTKVVAELIAKGADHMRVDPETGHTAKQIARELNDVEMLRTLDTHKSEYFAYRSDSQRSEDFASATSTPSATPGATPPLTPFSPLTSPPPVMSPPVTPAGPDFSKPAFRPRPPVLPH